VEPKSSVVLALGGHKAYYLLKALPESPDNPGSSLPEYYASASQA